MNAARIVMFIVAVMAAVPAGAPLPVTVTAHESVKRVDIAIGGKPFTSYIWPDEVKKPVLDPIRSERIDHPHHVGLWFYWHARGYGLFAANPLGQKVFSEGRETMNPTLQPGASVTFRYRVVVLEEKVPADRIEREFTAFADLF